MSRHYHQMLSRDHHRRRRPTQGESCSTQHLLTIVNYIVYLTAPFRYQNSTNSRLPLYLQYALNYIKIIEKSSFLSSQDVYFQSCISNLNPQQCLPPILTLVSDSSNGSVSVDHVVLFPVSRLRLSCFLRCVRPACCCGDLIVLFPATRWRLSCFLRCVRPACCCGP